MSDNALYMPSTPLNVLVSCALAVQARKEPSSSGKSELWLIDQKSEDNPYISALKAWPESPFQKIELFLGAAKGSEKLQERKQNFTKISQDLSELKPNIIAVGSDRRVEFQFALNQLKSTGQTVKGLYLDDGLYSYSGRKYHPIKDGINSILKKLSYGFWWQEPKTVGASSWIDEAWLFSPEQAVDLLQQKNCFKLQPEWFQTPEIVHLSQLVAQALQFDTSLLKGLDVVILIPHPNNILKMTGYPERIRKVVQLLSQQGKKVGVKYHPRTASEDALNLREEGAETIIPSQLAFEFCLPNFSSTCQVVGDVGTALLTTKWLRPDITTYAVLDEQDAFQKQFIPLNNAVNIQVVHNIEDIFE